MSECSKSNCGKCESKDGETFEDFFNRLFSSAEPEPGSVPASQCAPKRECSAEDPLGRNPPGQADPGAADRAQILSLIEENKKLRSAVRERADLLVDVRTSGRQLFEALVRVSKSDSEDSKTLIARNAVLEHSFTSLERDGLLDGIESVHYEGGILDIKWDEEQWDE